MFKVGEIILGQGPKVAVVVRDTESNDLLSVEGIDLLEVRIDQFQRLDCDYVKEKVALRKQTKLPLIGTIRNDKAEGAEKEMSDEQKLELFEAVIKDLDAVDIERRSSIADKVFKLACDHHKLCIVSSHDFLRTPHDDELAKIYKESKEMGGDIVKIAGCAHNMEDVFRLMKFTHDHKDDHVITMSLGEIGAISRLVFPAMGSLLTYSFISRPSAPGQINLETLREHFRFYYPSSS